MEYAIRQSAAIAREGVEVHFLCKPSFPVERFAEGISVSLGGVARREFFYEMDYRPWLR